MRSTGEIFFDRWGRLIQTIVVFLRKDPRRAWIWESKEEVRINLKVCPQTHTHLCPSISEGFKNSAYKFLKIQIFTF